MGYLCGFLMLLAGLRSLAKLETLAHLLDEALLQDEDADPLGLDN